LQVKKVGSLDFEHEANVDKDIMALLEGKGYVLEKDKTWQFNIFKIIKK